MSNRPCCQILKEILIGHQLQNGKSEQLHPLTAQKNSETEIDVPLG
jgi:hypothetical protein